MAIVGKKKRQIWMDLTKTDYGNLPSILYYIIFMHFVLGIYMLDIIFIYTFQRYLNCTSAVP